MSRRPLQHPIGRLAKAQQRMAPGGMVWSESPIPRRYSPRVPMVGDDETPAMVCVDLVADPDGHTWRPAGGAPFGPPTTGVWWYQLSMTLTAAVPSTSIDVEYGEGADTVTGGVGQYGGPWAAGATFAHVWTSTDWFTSGAPWEWARANYYYEERLWVQASAARLCYTATPPATAAQSSEGV